MHLEINRSDITEIRAAASTAPLEAPADSVVMRVEKLALTSNNITYAVAGDMLDYWGFFPAPDPTWGRLPAMGFGVVTASAVPAVGVGSRWYGFYPLADHHVVQPTLRGSAMVDQAAHRQQHAPVYRRFEPADPAATGDDDDAVALLRGLFVTSYLSNDYLCDNDVFGASQVLITSASSKTSLALAHEVRSTGRVRSVGLTSRGNFDFVVGTGLYDNVVVYDDIESLPVATAVVVDMAGSASILRRIHEHFGDALRYSGAVGVTHRNAAGDSRGMPGATPQFFFAPSQMQKRATEWGREVFETRLHDALVLFLVDARRWMTVRRILGPDAALDAYRELVAGMVDPSVGFVVTV